MLRVRSFPAIKMQALGRDPSCFDFGHGTSDKIKSRDQDFRLHVITDPVTFSTFALIPFGISYNVAKLMLPASPAFGVQLSVHHTTRLLSPPKSLNSSNQLTPVVQNHLPSIIGRKTSFCPCPHKRRIPSACFVLGGRSADTSCVSTKTTAFPNP